MRPPLQALHVFEAAARHLNYSQAAGELHVTHSAVSQQMRALENALGVPLFCRQGRQMLLTREGALLLKRIQPALQQLGDAVNEIGVLNRSPSITITTLQSIANRWLLPRLGRFQKLQPDVAVHIQASADLKDLVRAEADIAIRYGRGTWKGCKAEKLMEEWLFPVCSPDFNQGRLPRSINSLKRYRILTDDCHMEWQAWCKHAGIDFAEFVHGATYSDSNLMLGAAIAGQGIAIGRSALVSADIAAGRLVPVFELIAPAPFAYYLVNAEGRGMPPHLAAFAQWLHAEAAAFMRHEVRTLGLAA
ncbi:transcriptional regulator GcvA [Noviherbaspirillum sp. Root189]|uniref:transcriptional regulator GcvA n=1 Tax=Noviherbaspirillum sp. Root189 TaxID=1736487 RepID=UPI000715D0CA|nr:transcriptional regulator GcvA [Noviherbaspirillum sp. Root189]KRB79142.1 hypothetical protein ASE07_05560 [Noviherbaspirillum sp. Root189]